jgi:FkbM family methyltransferase
MNDFFDNINKNETGKLIHVGAGTGIDLKDYVTQSFVEILLLEPIPKVFKQLESKLEKLNKINVHCNITALNVALSGCADATKEKTFYITLPIRYSSLHKADKLKTIFQNLKTEQEITVSTINFSDLINQASLDKDKKNALVLQINGAEFEVLAQAETDELMLFSSVIIQHSNNNYFEDAKTSTDLIALMKTKGFQLAIEADNDVVFSSLVFRKDESTLKLKALTEQSKTQVTRIAELENQLKASNEAKVSELTEARAKANASAEHSKTQSARIGELENQLKASNEAKANETNKANTSAEQNKTKTARIGELENQLKASNEAKANETNKANASAEQNKTKTARIGELETQLKASNEAKASETNKANVSVEQSKTQVARIGELETQLKASNEAKASETNKANASVEQSKTQVARIGELENQLKASNEAKVSEVTEARAEATAKANTSAEQNKTKTARIGELENQLKASNEAKVSEVTEARAEATAKANASAEQNKTQTARIAELENQLKASNEAKASETNKANATAEQSKPQSARIGELENLLKASNEAKTSESNKAKASAEQSKTQTARIGELENQLKAINEAKVSELNEARAKANASAEQSKTQSARIGELKNQLKVKAEQDETADKLNSLLKQVQNQNDAMNKNHNSLVSKLKYGFDNSVKQVESFIGVQSYLETGQLAMEYHGWPISSDVALFLLGKVEKNNYDLIIEFGSGTSTQLFAKAINNQVKNQATHIDDDLSFIGRDKTDSSALSTLPLELPNRIVTFEHNKKYHSKTMAELKANKLSHLVDLVHAPLIEMKIENEDYLYYSCETKLSQLASIYAERTARILVLIDGPPGATGPLARLPAIPLLLNYLGKHQLDIVLDDYKRQEEKDTVVRWKKQFEKRYLEYNEEQVQCEKGVFFCRINP